MKELLDLTEHIKERKTASEEIEETLAKWNMTEKELLLVLWVTLKQKEKP